MRRSYWKNKKEVSPLDVMNRRLLAAEIISALENNGFSRCTKLETNYGNNSEIVYAKPSLPGSRRIIAVYTSCNQIGGAFIARASGKDAIRVSGLYINRDNISKGIVKNQRVNRVGAHEDIVNRLTERIIKTSRLLNIVDCCKECGAPNFLSKKNNLVCAELCWRNNAC